MKKLFLCLPSAVEVLIYFYLIFAAIWMLSGCANLTPEQRTRLDEVYVRLLGVATDTVVRSIQGLEK